MVFSVSILLLTLCCTQKSPIELPTYQAPVLWSEPIEAYLQLGHEKFGDDFDKSIGTLKVFDEKLWFGYGDTRVNMGSYIPIEFRYFENPSEAQPLSAKVRGVKQGAPQRNPFDTGEERIVPFKEFEGKLWQAGYDSNNADELWTQSIPNEEKLIQGNLFILRDSSTEPIWEKKRTVSGGEHVHDLAYFEEALFAVGSGAANRKEWESGQIFRYLWVSKDQGASFEVFRRDAYSMQRGDTRYRALLPVSDQLYVFGYINPYAINKPMQSRHLIVKNGISKEAEGEITQHIVWKTWPLNSRSGLAIGGVDVDTTQTFFIDKKGPRRLENWSIGKVVYVSKDQTPKSWLVLFRNRTTNTQSLYKFDERTPDELELVMTINGNDLSSFAIWKNGLYFGTEKGKILRAEHQ